jgi:hypothetical protein
MQKPELKDISVSELKRALENKSITFKSTMKKQELYSLLYDGKKEEPINKYDKKYMTKNDIMQFLTEHNIKFKRTSKKDDLYLLLDKQVKKMIPIRYILAKDLDEYLSMHMVSGASIISSSAADKLRKLNTIVKQYKYDIRPKRKGRVKREMPPFSQIIFEESNIYSLTDLRAILSSFEEITDQSLLTRRELINKINTYYTDTFVSELPAGSTLLNKEDVDKISNPIYYGNRRFYKVVEKT